ncbi:MAG: HAD family hydrolase [Lachnospiraceae bacterium]|nr:HAD family hydrolase [Lachnospiraceae bacterium]
MSLYFIFDCFGTLIDTGMGSIEATARILKNVDANENADAFYKEWKDIKKKMMYEHPFRNEKTLFELSLGEMFLKYGIKADASKEVEPMIRTLFSQRIVFPETRELLHGLDDKGVEYAIGSTTDTDSILHYLSLNKLNIKKIYTSEDMQVYKPNPLFYTTILKSCGWNVDECIFVGDNLIDDIKGPQSIGMKTVLIDRNRKYRASDVMPDYVINSLLELNDINWGS